MKIAVSLRHILNAFRIAGQRAKEVGQPSLGVWTDAGHASATQFGAGVGSAAHSAKVHDEEAAKEIEAGLAGLSDGKADPEDIERFRRAARLVAKSAELDHQIGEAAQA